jgi:glycosyltransferase involved in cell wall biosynthesis
MIAAQLSGSSDLKPHRDVDDFTVLTFGHMNPNKRQESVIRALGNSDVLRRNARYRLVGRIEADHARHFTQVAHSVGVDLDFIPREVDNPTLAQAIQQAAVVSSLRFPVLEAASASTIEAMLWAKATLVTDVGFYSDLPDDCVCKVSPEHEIEDVQRILETLYAYPERRVALGAAAARWASEAFSPAHYTAELVKVCERTIEAAPAIAAGRFFAETLIRWGATEALIESSDVLSHLTPLAR